MQIPVHTCTVIIQPLIYYIFLIVRERLAHIEPSGESCQKQYTNFDSTRISSLPRIFAFYRLVEPAAGNIVIDDEDIANLGLHKLRKKLTIIPQVLYHNTK